MDPNDIVVLLGPRSKQKRVAARLQVLGDIYIRIDLVCLQTGQEMKIPLQLEMRCGRNRTVVPISNSFCLVDDEDEPEDVVMFVNNVPYCNLGSTSTMTAAWKRIKGSSSNWECKQC